MDLYIHKYKNLSEIHLQLTPRTVLYGQNGVGKTNLLEALALLCGDRVTVHQLAHRALVPAAGAIEVVVAASPELLAGVTTNQPDESANEDFWSSLGVDALPDSWESGINDSWLNDKVREAVLDPSTCGVRYSLRSISGLNALATFDRGVAHRDGSIDERPELSRIFERTLCIPRDQGIALQRLGANVPDGARPLLREQSGHDPWFDLLILPPTQHIPLEVVWLARERTDDEIWCDFEQAVNRTASCVRLLTTMVEHWFDGLEWPDQTTDESPFIARWWFADDAQAAIAALLPQLELSALDDWLTVSPRADTGTASWAGQPGDLSWISRLSSGERVLVDEALVDAAQALRRRESDITAAFTALYARQGDPEARLELQRELASSLLIFGEEYWSISDVETLLALGKRALEARHSYPPHPRAHVIRIFDEPERHLHRRAQSQLAATLSELITDNHVIVSTHSSEFLANDGWQHIHVFRTPEGTVLDDFEPHDLELNHRVANDLGMNAADLLTRVRYVLLVEGPHDEAFLDGYCGDWLRSLGVIVLPMHGAWEVLQAAQAHFIVRHLDAGVGVLVDNARTEVGDLNDSKEADLIRRLRSFARRRGLEIDDFLLERKDIIAYIDDDVMREVAPRFPGFRSLERLWRKRLSRPDFKDFVSENAGGFGFTPTKIRDLAEKTARSGKTPPQDLTDFLSALTEAARRRDQRWR